MLMHLEAVKSFYQTYTRLSKVQWMYWLLFYAICWVFLSITEAFGMRNSEASFFYWEPWVDQFGWVFCFGFLSPLIGYVCHRWSMESQKLMLSAIKLILFYFPFKVIYLTLVLMSKHILNWLFTGELANTEPLIYLYFFKIFDSSPVYVAAVFVVYTKIYFQTAQREQVNAAKLEGELQKTRMDVLRSQLQPHFLFNTLNLISSTMYRDVDKADSIVTRLGDLLRYSLATEQNPFVPLKEEVQVMTSFLEIAKLRFGDRLSTFIDIAPETNDILIPAMLLQPLLENAVKYGIEPSDENGEISLTTTLESAQLVITITNPWHQRRAQQESFGIGLNNTRNRLFLLYEDLASVNLETTENQQVILFIRLPVDQAETP